MDGNKIIIRIHVKDFNLILYFPLFQKFRSVLGTLRGTAGGPQSLSKSTFILYNVFKCTTLNQFKPNVLNCLTCEALHILLKK